MKRKLYIFALLLIFVFGLAGAASAQRKSGNKNNNASASFVKTEKEELEAALAMPPAERLEKLKVFVAEHPRSTFKARVMELIVSAHAALGDEKLKAGDIAGGTQQFRAAVAEIPQGMSDKLFSEVVSQIPSNLFLRGERTASIEVARLVEERIKDDPKRLLMIAAFYLAVEAVDEATRVADLSIKLAPEMSAAYQARAAAHRIALRLEESAADYARALELDTKSEAARRSLADLRRATGKTEEALALYRARVAVDATDEFARTGLVVSLFELGKKEEAERELEKALTEMPRSLALMVGAAYWFAAHNEGARAVELAQKAVELEPRYVWGHIALARGLIAQKRPLEAERVLVFARQYGRFPTLDYDLASALVAAGFYGEAAAELMRSFAIKDEQIETYLAGRTLARSSNFTELLAPERRASIFQFKAADAESNARLLKSLLAFNSALSPAGGRAAIKEAEVMAAAQEFIAGGDDANMRVYRSLYVAGRLLENRVALSKIVALTEAATGEVEASLEAPTASVAVMAEELRDTRARANNYGETLPTPVIPRGTLLNILRGRIEDTAGWSLFHQDKFPEAVVRLKRATSVLPEGSIWWRNSLWHLGAALDASGNAREALEAYVKSYRSGGADLTRRTIIESLYRKINGSLDGLDAKIGATPAVASNNTAAASPSESPAKIETTVEPTTEPKSEPTPTPTPESTPTPEPTPEATPVEVPPGPPQPAENDEPPAMPSPTPTPTVNEETAKLNTADKPVTKGERRSRRVAESKCSLATNESSLTIRNNSGSAIITITLDGAATAEGVTAQISDWSAIAVFPEPKSSAEGNANTVSFSIASISKKTGSFIVTFKSPCGSKDVTVTVK